MGQHQDDVRTPVRTQFMLLFHLQEMFLNYLHVEKMKERKKKAVQD